MLRTPLFGLLATVLASFGCDKAEGQIPPQVSATAPIPQAPVLTPDLELTALDGSPFDASSLEGQVVLFVNVASRCGFTPQYEGLQALYDSKKSQGFVVVGVPCNQFAGQEPGSPEQIASFCAANYGVDFPLLEKQKVNGGGRSELYARLIDSPVGGGARVKWNFEKFLVGRDGQVVARFGSTVKPTSEELVSAIDKALAAPRP